MLDKDKLTYWEKRAAWLEQQQHDEGTRYIGMIITSYEQAQKYLTDEVDRIYKRYLTKSGLSADDVAKILNTQIKPADLVVLKHMINTTSDPAVKKQMQTYLNGLAVKSRITRLELLRAKSYVVAKQLADVQLKASKPYYIDVMQDAYNHASAEAIIGQTQKDFNVYRGEAIPKINTQAETIKFVSPVNGHPLHTINVVPDKPIKQFKELSTQYLQRQLNASWHGENYSSRIWNNTDDLALELQSLFNAKQLSGMTNHDMTQALMQKFATSAYQARRLVRTEAAYMSNQARLQAWQAHDVREYSLLAVLDFRTSQICRHMDGKVFPVAQAKVDGVNGTYPPFHPNCRTVAVAHFTDTANGGNRTARDPITNATMRIPADSTYQDWEKILIKRHGMKVIKQAEAKQ